MKLKFKLLHLALFSLFLTVSLFAKMPADGEFIGQFDTTLAANTEDFERIIFKNASAASFKNFGVKEDAQTSLSRLYNPQTGRASVTSLLVEYEDENPVIFVDLNEDKNFTDDEKFPLKKELEKNPYLWNATINLPVKNGFFTAASIFVRYFREVEIEEMSEGDRLITQSTDVFARGTVDIKGKKIAVQYEYDFESKKISPQKGWLGVDTNEDGKVDMDSLSFEAAKATDETVIFRVGNMYVSTQKVDLKQNQIIMREHAAKDYKRIELEIGKELPDFEFVDLDGKKRRFSEFRGKYVIIDFWGLWCPACRDEIPYLRESYKRYKSRNFEILGMNTDPFSASQIKEVLNKSDIKWTQAKLESIGDLLNVTLRIESFPTTFLVSPEGKLLSMSRHERDELDLRGEDLLDTLDKILPK